jgi:hypothetical protein
MPVVAFKCPLTGDEITLDEGPAYFDEQGIMPAAAVKAVLHSVESRRDEDPRFLNPSGLCPTTNCRRKILLRRFVDYSLDPTTMWAAEEGSVWHRAFAEGGLGEVRLPDDILDGPRAAELNEQLLGGKDGKIRVEVSPGLWLRGTADSIEGDTITDYKTKAFPYARYPEWVPAKNWAADGKYTTEWREELSYQLSAYAAIVEVVTGTAPSRAWAWRIFSGSKNRAWTFLKVPVRLWDRAELAKRVMPWANPLLVELERAYNAKGNPEALATIIDSTPPDGHDKQLFNGQMCSKYCEMRPHCPLFADSSLEF